MAVLGAGPAGLAAAYVLAQRDERGIVFEADASVGGLAKTVEFKGYRFDLGGHRFFTRLAPVERLWSEMLGADFLVRPRLSRIYYRGEFFSYPLGARDVLRRVGLPEAIRCTLSYLRSRGRQRRPPATFEEWVTSRFGKRLYDIFFSSYTEKVWGIPGSEIRAEWAAQRIRSFSLLEALLAILGLRREHATLLDEFRYPRLGPGQMWEAFADHVEEAGLPIRLGERCVAVRHRDQIVESIVAEGKEGMVEHRVDAVLSSMPLGELVLMLSPPAPGAVQAAARRLRYRDLCVVALMTSETEPFPDNWIYLHDPGTRAGRVQNFGSWSSDLVVPGTTCLGVEYFCFAGDEIWELTESEAVALAKEELARIGLIDPAKVFDGTRVRVSKAYPMYDGGYREAVEVLRSYLERFPNLKTFGRNGLHRYNNQDHSMWTAILATLNLLDGSSYDVWEVNTEQSDEEGEAIDALGEIELVLVH